MLYKSRLVITVSNRKIIAAAHLVIQIVQSCQYAVTIAQCQSIQPVNRIAVAIVDCTARKQLIEVFLFVLAVAQLDTALPNVADSSIQPDTGSAEAVLIVRRCRKGLKKIVIPATKRIVDLGFAALIQHSKTCFQTLIEAVAQAQGKGTVAVGVVIRI